MQRSATLLFVSSLALAAAQGAFAADASSAAPGASTSSSSGTAPGSTGSTPSASGSESTSASPSTGASAPQSDTTSSAAASESPAKKIFDQLDSNKDGTLTLEEFSRAQFQQQ